MLKNDVTKAMSQKCNLTIAQCEEALIAFCETTEEAMINREPIMLFGYFKIFMQVRKAKKGQDMKHGGCVDIPARYKLAIKSGAQLKQAETDV